MSRPQPLHPAGGCLWKRMAVPEPSFFDTFLPALSLLPPFSVLCPVHCLVPLAAAMVFTMGCWLVSKWLVSVATFQSGTDLCRSSLVLNVFNARAVSHYLSLLPRVCDNTMTAWRGRNALERQEDQRHREDCSELCHAVLLVSVVPWPWVDHWALVELVRLTSHHTTSTSVHSAK